MSRTSKVSSTATMTLASKKHPPTPRLLRPILPNVEKPFSETDVLCGHWMRHKGEASLLEMKREQHSGNKKFNKLIQLNLDLFRESTKGQRAALARSIVTIVCTAFKPPGRFLQLHPAQDRWSDMSEQEARFVTMLALLRAIHGCCVKDNAADLLGVKGTIATQNNIAGKRKLDDTMKASPTSHVLRQGALKRRSDETKKAPLTRVPTVRFESAPTGKVYDTKKAPPASAIRRQDAAKWMLELKEKAPATRVSTIRFASAPTRTIDYTKQAPLASVTRRQGVPKWMWEVNKESPASHVSTVRFESAPTRKIDDTKKAPPDSPTRRQGEPKWMFEVNKKTPPTSDVKRQGAPISKFNETKIAPSTTFFSAVRRLGTPADTKNAPRTSARRSAQIIFRETRLNPDIIGCNNGKADSSEPNDRNLGGAHMAAIDKRAHRQAARTNRVDSDDAMAQDGGHDHKRLCQEIGYHEPLGKGAIGRARSQGPSGCRVPNQGPTRIHCLRTTATSSSYAPRGRELADSFFSRVLVHRADVDGPLDQTCSHQGPSYCRNEEEVTTTKKLAGLSKEHEVGHCAEGPLSRVRRSFVTKPPPQSTTMQQPMSMIHSLTGPSPYAQVVPDTDATVVDPLLNISSYPDKVEISILKYRRSEYMDMQKHAHSVGLAGEVSNLQKRISTITECIADYEDRCIKALYHEKSVKDNIYNRGGKRGLSK